MPRLICFTLAEHPLSRGLGDTLDAFGISSEERGHVFYATEDPAALSGLRGIPERPNDPRVETLLMALGRLLVGALKPVSGLPDRVRLGYHAGGSWDAIVAATEANGTEIVRIDQSLLSRHRSRSPADAFDALAAALQERRHDSTTLAARRAWVLEGVGDPPTKLLPRLQWQEVWSLVPLGELPDEHASGRLVRFMGCVGPKGTPSLGGPAAPVPLDWALSPLVERLGRREVWAAAASANTPAAHLLLIAACGLLRDYVEDGSVVALAEAARRATYATTFLDAACRAWLGAADMSTLPDHILSHGQTLLPEMSVRLEAELSRRKQLLEATPAAPRNRLFVQDAAGVHDARFRLCLLEEIRSTGRFTTEDLRRHLASGGSPSAALEGDDKDDRDDGAILAAIEAAICRLAGYPLGDADWAAVETICPDGGDEIYALIEEFVGVQLGGESPNYFYESAAEALRCPSLQRVTLDSYFDDASRDADETPARLRARGVTVDGVA